MRSVATQGDFKGCDAATAEAADRAAELAQAEARLATLKTAQAEVQAAAQIDEHRANLVRHTAGRPTRTYSVPQFLSSSVPHLRRHRADDRTQRTQQLNEVWTGTPQVQVTESPATRDTRAALTDAILTAMRNHLAEACPVPPPLRTDNPGDKGSGDGFEDRAGVLIGRALQAAADLQPLGPRH